MSVLQTIAMFKRQIHIKQFMAVDGTVPDIRIFWDWNLIIAQILLHNLFSTISRLRRLKDEGHGPKGCMNDLLSVTVNS